MTSADLPLMMKEFANDAVSFARDQYEIVLDYSEESLDKIENILDALYQELQTKAPDEVSEQGLSKDDFVHIVSHLFGGYVGETMRKRFGGEWKLDLRVSDVALVCLEIGTTVVFPPSKVFKRLTDGSGDNGPESKLPESDNAYYGLILMRQSRADGLKGLCFISS
jgi:hypothetical protein